MLWQNVRKTDTKVFPSHAAYRRYADYTADSSVKLVQNVFNQYADAQKSLDYSAIYNVARNTFDKLPSGDLKRIFRTAIHHVIQNDPRFVQSGYEIRYIEPNSSGSSASPSNNSNNPDLAKIMHDYAHNLAEDRDGDEQNERPPKLQTRQETGEQTTQTTSPEGTESLAEQRRQAKARAEKRVHEITALHNLCDAVLNFVIQAHEVSMQDAFTAVQKGCKVAQCYYNQGEVDDYINQKAGVIVESNNQIMVNNYVKDTIPVGKQFEQAANTAY